jgi:hypothetical protein
VEALSGLSGIVQTFGIAGVLAFVLLRLEAQLAANTLALTRLSEKIAVLLDRQAAAVDQLTEALRVEQDRPRSRGKRSAPASPRQGV